MVLGTWKLLGQRDWTLRPLEAANGRREGETGQDESCERRGRDGKRKAVHGGGSSQEAGQRTGGGAAQEPGHVLGLVVPDGLRLSPSQAWRLQG